MKTNSPNPLQGKVINNITAQWDLPIQPLTNLWPAEKKLPYHKKPHCQTFTEKSKLNLQWTIAKQTTRMLWTWFLYRKLGHLFQFKLDEPSTRTTKINWPLLAFYKHRIEG